MPGDIVRSNHDTDAPGLYARKKSYQSITLSGNLTLDDTYPNVLKLDPGGSARDVTLDVIATSEGVYRTIKNGADAAENLVVKNPAGDTIGTINQNEEGEFYCNGTTWALVNIATIALS